MRDFKCDDCNTTVKSKHTPQNWLAFHGQFSKNKELIAIVHKYICSNCHQSDFKGGRIDEM
jgi:Zn finger protein HypA/HybF involved in hydrogenase expression